MLIARILGTPQKKLPNKCLKLTQVSPVVIINTEVLSYFLCSEIFFALPRAPFKIPKEQIKCY